MKFPKKIFVSIKKGIGNEYLVACPKITDHNIEGFLKQIIGIYELKKTQKLSSGR